MRVTIREYDRTKMNYEKTWRLVNEAKPDRRCILGIDASSTNTGISIVGAEGSLLYTMALHREDKESPVEFKLKYKEFMRSLIETNLNIEKIWYEEHFIGYAEAAKILFMLRSTIEEIIIEDKLHISYNEMSNKKWKKYLFQMCNYGKCPSGTDLEKKAVRECLLAQMPGLDGITQDEFDSLGVTMVALMYGSTGDLESKKKPKKFNYEVKFFGGDEEDDSDFFLQYGDGTGIVPKKLVEENCIFYELNGREKFDNAIYRQLCDDDVPLILKFKSSKYGDIVLRNEIGYLSDSYENIYAVVWRKTRKRV